MGSTRLPGKVMKKLDNENSVLHYVVKQIESSKLIDRIVIATTNLPEDKIIVDFAKKIKKDYFIGDSQDVLSRYYHCAKKFSFPTIVRITSDTPFIDPTITDKIIETFNSNKYDYVCNTQPRTFPQGTETEVFSFNALEKAWKHAKLPSEREHVTPYLYTHQKQFKIFNVKNSKDLSEFRWTVDHQDDLEFVRKLVCKIKKRPILTNDILQILDNNKGLLKINKDHLINEGYFKSLKEDKEFLQNSDKN